MKSWFSVENKSTGSLDISVLDISIHDEIGVWGVTAKEFINELQAADAQVINLSIHSPGGSVTDGFAIYNALVNHPAKIYGKVEGIAASAASFILMAADSIEMPEDSFLMIHNAWGGAIGDAEELREAAAVIDKLQDSIVNIYMKRTGLDEELIRDMMDKETWLNAADALGMGFADTITDPIKAAAKIHNFNRYFKNMPVENVLADVSTIENEKEFERFLREADAISNRLAKALTSQAKAIFQRDVEETPADDYEQLTTALKQLQNKL